MTHKDMTVRRLDADGTLALFATVPSKTRPAGKKPPAKKAPKKPDPAPPKR